MAISNVLSFLKSSVNDLQNFQKFQIFKMFLFRYFYPIQSKMVMSDITCTTCPSLTIPFDRLNRYRKYNLSSSHWWACQKSIFVFRGCNIRYIFQEYSVSKFYFELQPQSLRSSWFQFLNSKTIPSMSSTKKIAVFGRKPRVPA